MALSNAAGGRWLQPEPMLATLGAPPGGQGWAVELKHDGQRGRVIVDGQVRVLSRNGADITATFPELSAGIPAAIGVGRKVVLDGEIVALDRDGRPSFERLQRRWPQQRRPSATLVRQVAVRFYAFDVLAVATPIRYRPRRAKFPTPSTSQSGASLRR